MGKKQVQDYVQDTRNDLGATLNEIEHRLSPAELTKSGIAWVSNSYDRNPMAWLVGGILPRSYVIGGSAGDKIAG